MKENILENPTDFKLKEKENAPKTNENFIITNNKVKITFFGGLGEVGGNLVLLEDLVFDVRIIIDFGINVKRYYEEYEKGRKPSNINELVSKELLPDPRKLSLKNLYKDFKIEETDSFNALQNLNLGIKTQQSKYKEIDGIFISHPHKDHFWGLNFINRSIPVHTGIVTRNIILALSESEKPDIMNNYKRINWQVFRTGAVIKVKELIIVPSHVDHSVPASYGFIFYTSAGPIVYTGDFRRHGPLAFMTEDFLNEILEHNLYQNYIKNNPQLKPVPLNDIKLLMVEGTRIAKGTIEAEEFVEENLKKLFEMNPFNFMLVKYERTDWDRFRTFSNFAKKYGWKFVLGERDAFFYYILNQDKHHNTMKDPNILNDDHILIVKWGNADLTWKKRFRKILEDHKKCYRLFDSYKNLPRNESYITEKGNKKKKSIKYMIFMTHLSNQLTDYIKLYGKNNRGVFISSSIDQYTEDAYDGTNTLIRKLREFGITGYKVHASGHVNCHALLDFIDRINPELLVPIHTNHPELFKQFYLNSKGQKTKVLNPKRYKEIFIS